MEGGIFAGGFLVGGIFGLLFGSLVMSWDTRSIIDKCELNLPRTQHCVLTALPAQGEKHD